MPNRYSGSGIQTAGFPNFFFPGGAHAAADERWTAMIDIAAQQPPSFGEKSYYFGTNIPGKPHRYLLNAGGRPKLFKEIARVRATDYKAFGLSRSAS